ncbi:MAG TPA: sulfotransferase domain-containing protein [Terriglobales bacterium]|jgi:hypothetical protein|nr:sulfotransferase domain-containing protein [Terriglobales bacterium]
MARKPNFFIIGAPKCGTTSLATYLREHPKIFFPARKELLFFNTDMASRAVRSEADYYGYFSDAQPQHIAVGEGSVTYLYSDAAVPNILKAIPDAKFIVMARNPIDMAVSLHAQLHRQGDENLKDFATAWHVQEKRKKGKRIPPLCTDPSLLLYGNVCSVGWQLKRLYTRVARHRVLVLFQDDLKRDTRSVYLQTLEFLGVPDDGRTAFGVHNTRQPRLRSQLFQAVLRSIGVLKLRLGVKRSFRILPLIERLNVTSVRESVIDREFKVELAQYFRNDVEEMSTLVDRDLSAWLRV